MAKGQYGGRTRKIKRNHPSIKISHNNTKYKKYNLKLSLNNNIKHNLTHRDLIIIIHYIKNKPNKLRILTEKDLI